MKMLKNLTTYWKKEIVKRRQSLKVKKTRGFTFMELLLVITMLAVLSSIAVPMFSNKSDNAKRVTHNQNVGMLNMQGSAYLAALAKHPDADEELIDDLEANGYIHEIPTNPLTGIKDYSVMYRRATRTIDVTPIKQDDDTKDYGAILTIVSNEGDKTGAGSIIYTFTFTQNVTGFEKSDISVINGTPGEFNIVNATTYTLVVTNSGPCIQTVSVPSDACRTQDNKPNKAASKNVIIIDTTPPDAPIFDATPAIPTNGNVTVTITYPVDAIVRQYKIGNQGLWTTYTVPVVITSNETVYARGTDAAENTSTEASCVVDNIDRTAPTATVSYSTTVPTNQNVTATITPSETVAITNNGGLSTYTFTANGSFTFNFTDAAGNTGSVVATVSNIDKVAPTAPTFSATPTTPTNGNVTVTITYPVDASTKQYKVGSGGTWTAYTSAVIVTTNNTVYARGIDEAGNTSTEATCIISNIDKTPPTATVSYSTTAPTNQNVTATITPSETVTITNNGGLSTYTFTANGSFTFNFTDIAGNTGSVVATVNNIDKIPPAPPNISLASGTYSAIQTVSVVAVEPGVVSIRYTLDGSDPTVSSTSYTSAISISTTTTFKIRAWDAAGNASVVATYTYTFDTTPPTVTFSPNGGTTPHFYYSTAAVISDNIGFDNSSYNLKHLWTTDSSLTAPVSGWTSFAYAGQTLTSPADYSGNIRIYYLWIKLSDYAGNVATVRSNGFTVNK